MTLLEVVVYCVLLGLFTTILFFTLPNRGNATVEDVHEATSTANTVLTELGVEVGNASSTSFSVLTSPVGVVFLSASKDRNADFTYLSTGELAWQGWIGYFVQGTNLVRVWYPLPAAALRSAVTTTPTAATMLASGTSQVICQNVSSFSVFTKEANLWQFELTLTIKKNVVTLSSGAGARN